MAVFRRRFPEKRRNLVTFYHYDVGNGGFLHKSGSIPPDCIVRRIGKVLFNQGDIQNYINSGYALVAITGNASSGNILHDIIIYGYDTSAGVDYVYLIDPSTGTSLFRTRGQLDNGSWKNGVYLPYGGTIYPYCAGLFPNP